MKVLSKDEIDLVSGADLSVSPETVGCAVGGAMGSELGPWGAAVGCVVGGALANYYMTSNISQYMIIA